MPLTELQVSRRHVALGLAAGLGCWVVLAALSVGGVFEAFDHRLLDWRFRLRGERVATKSIALVSIDDVTIRAYGGWPLPRDQYALLLDVLAASGARAIGVDLQLPEDMNHDPRHDALLAYVSGEHPNIVHAISFFATTQGRQGAPTVPAASLEALHRQGIVDDEVHVPFATGVSLPYPGLMEAAAALGHITVAADRDGAIRRQPFLVRFEDRVYPSLALRMIGVGSGQVGNADIQGYRNGIRVRWGKSLAWRLPLDREGSTSLDFAGDRRAFSNSHSMIEILRAHQAGDSSGLRQRFTGRYVLVGLDSQTEVTEDVGTTPFAATTPLVFIHANALDNLLRKRFLDHPAPGMFLALLGAGALLLGWLFAILPMITAAIVAGSALLAVAIADFVFLAVWSIDVPPLATLLVAPLTFIAVTSGRYLFLESRSRAREAEIREGRVVEQQFLPEALIGHDLGRYSVLEELGRGGMGVVYRGMDPRLRRDVAIKVLPGRALADEKSRKRFRREALALSKLQHPQIAGIFDFDTQDGTDFLVMEFVPGVPLTTHLRRGPLSEGEVVRISSAVAGGLAEAHAHGVIHRDLKPENIMLTRDGAVKVLDFGLALFLDSAGETSTRSQNLTEDGRMVGTIPYMAPEVLRGSTAEPRSDLYSLGVAIFEMATGKRPFPDDAPHELLFTILHQDPPTPRILNGRISEGLEAVILKLLRKEPSDRYGSAAELLEALRVLSPTGSAGNKTPTRAADPEILHG